MKKIYIGLFWACILGITGCYEDDSTMATPESMVNEITIEEFADTSAVAYSTVLELTPKVTGYSDTELEYRWYIYGGEFSDRTEDGYRTVQIGAEKKLSYPVELKIGTYTVVCEVTNKETGYFNLTEFSLKSVKIHIRVSVRRFFESDFGLFGRILYFKRNDGRKHGYGFLQ